MATNASGEGVAASLERIRSWLGANAPEALADLRGPASPEQFEDLERQVGVGLPADLREAYLIHDGQGWEAGGVFLDYRWMALERIPGRRELLLSSRDGAVPDVSSDGPVRRRDADPAWVPFAVSRDGSYYCVDMNPGASGRPGRVIAHSTDAMPPSLVAESFAGFVAGVASEFESGQVAYSVDHKLFGRADWVATLEPPPSPNAPIVLPTLDPASGYQYKFRREGLPGPLAEEWDGLLKSHNINDPHVQGSLLLISWRTPGVIIDLYASGRGDNPYALMLDSGDPRGTPHLLRLEGDEARSSPWLDWAERLWVETNGSFLTVQSRLPFEVEGLPETLRAPFLELVERSEGRPSGPLRYRIDTGKYPGFAIECRGPDDDPEAGWHSIWSGSRRRFDPEMDEPMTEELREGLLAWYAANAKRWTMPD